MHTINMNLENDINGTLVAQLAFNPSFGVHVIVTRGVLHGLFVSFLIHHLQRIFCDLIVLFILDLFVKFAEHKNLFLVVI